LHWSIEIGTASAEKIICEPVRKIMEIFYERVVNNKMAIIPDERVVDTIEIDSENSNKNEHKR